MAKNSRYFKLIDPRFPENGLKGHPGLSRLVSEAAIGFALDEIPKTEAGAVKVLSAVNLTEFEDGVAAVQSL